MKVYCEYDEDTIWIEKTTDYTSTYSANTLTVTLVATSEYYYTPKVKVSVPMHTAKPPLPPET